MSVFLGIVTALVAVVGLWLAHNYRRQMKLKLSQTRLEAYSRLWEITGIAAPTRLDACGDDGYLRLDERRDLWAAMTDWYYGQGGGMLLTATTKVVYLNVKHNLVCESSKLCPDGLYEKIRTALDLPEDQEFDDKVRGTLAIRLVSLLRTQLKSDLTIYGSTYSGRLANYERCFLEDSGVKLYSKAWASATGQKAWRLRLRGVTGRLLKRLQAVVKKSIDNPQQLPKPKPSPLREIPAILNVGGAPLTPPSSRIAIRNALLGCSPRSAQWPRRRLPTPASINGSIPPRHITRAVK